ncbi:MAG: hypothetical protein QOE70_6676 [Chthoniobacter sp.]|jgi:hypothetical protein|nr:hypothetical protein [Chthoniobacter sp.]
MKSFRVLVLAVVAAFSLSACLQQEKLIKLKADGSGTIEETVVMSKEAVGQMKQMGSGLGAALGGGKSAGGGEPFQLLDEKKLREAAGKMGDGVTFVSAKPVTTPMGEGYTAIYAFADVNKLKIRQDLGDSMPAGAGAGMGLPKKAAKADPVTFRFVKGAPATLTVNLPQPKPGDLPKREQKPTAEGGDEMAMMMLQQVFKDMKATMAIEVAGRIVQSNAEFQDSSRVTLLEMDFNKVLANPEKFSSLAKTQPKTVEEMKTLVKGIDGIKVEIQPQVTVKFQ